MFCQSFEILRNQPTTIFDLTLPSKMETPSESVTNRHEE